MSRLLMLATSGLFAVAPPAKVTAQRSVMTTWTAAYEKCRPLFDGRHFEIEMTRGLKVESHAAADQVLAELVFSVTHIQRDVVEKMIFHERAPMARPVVIGPGHYIPRQ
jgi:hypothetical protein